MGNRFDNRVDYLAFRLLFSYIFTSMFSNKESEKLRVGVLVGCYNFDEQNKVLTTPEKTELLKLLTETCIMYRKWSEVIKYAKKLLNLSNHSNGEYVCYRLGIFYRNHGDFRKALCCFEKCLEISKEQHDIWQEMSAYSGLGSIYCDIGEYEKAEGNLKLALKISEKLPVTIQIGRNHHDLANVYFKLGMNEKALEHYKKALKIAEDERDMEGEDRACSSLGRFYRRNGALKKAARYHERCLNISKDSGVLRDKGISLLNLGNVHNDLGEYQTAIKNSTEAFEIAKQCNDISLMELSNFCLGFAYHCMGQHEKSCRYLCQSISGRDKIREGFQKQDQFNMSLSKQSFKLHMYLIEGLLKLKHIKKALLVLDVGRSKSLFDLLRLSSIKINFSQRQFNKLIEQIPSMLGDPEKDSHSDISDNVCRSLQDGTVLVYGFDLFGITLFIWVLTQQGTVLRHFLPPTAANVNSAKVFFKKIVNKIMELHRKGRSPLNLEDKRDSLRESNVKMLNELPEELINEPIQKAFQTAKQFASKVAPGNSGKATGEVSSRSPAGAAKPYSAAASHVREAYQALIAPVEDLLRGTKLIIVPADSLFLLPFCALVDDEGKKLCDRYSIQVTPALHTLNYSLSIPKKELGPALFVGNSNLDKVFFQDDVINLEHIPGAGIEAAECADFFDVEPLINEQATKKKVIERLTSASVVHIAAHGNLNYGEIFLAPNPEAPTCPKEEHYLLRPADILKCSLSARLVVLSCCHSGRGKISSEGVAGTARAFLGAGARAVLVALWPLPDQETRKFMKLFYENVCNEFSVCVALQQAMISFKEQDDRMEVWAPFEIFGEDVTITSEDLTEIRRLSRGYKEK